MRRLTILSEVVLPQPDGPTRMQILPAGTVSDRSLTAAGSAPPLRCRRVVRLGNVVELDDGAVGCQAGHRSHGPPRGDVAETVPQPRSGVTVSGPRRYCPVPVRRGHDMKITAIRLDRVIEPLDPPFDAAWDPVPRRSFAATIVRVETDEGVVGTGSGDTMAGFSAFEHLFIGQDPLAIARHVRSSRRSTSTPAGTGRSRSPSGTSPARSRTSRSRPCSAARATASRRTRRAGRCCRPRRARSPRSGSATRASGR